MTRGSGIEELLLRATAGLGEARPGDLPDVLRLAWLGFITAGAAGWLLALRADPDQYAPLWDNARPVLAAAAQALRASGSLPAGLPDRISLADGLDDPLGDRAAARIRDGILAVALALNTVLPQAGSAPRSGPTGVPAGMRPRSRPNWATATRGGCARSLILTAVSYRREAAAPAQTRNSVSVARSRVVSPAGGSRSIVARSEASGNGC